MRLVGGDVACPLEGRRRGAGCRSLVMCKTEVEQMEVFLDSFSLGPPFGVGLCTLIVALDGLAGKVYGKVYG